MPIEELPPQEAVLDTDTLSAIVRRDPKAIAKANDYLQAFHKLAFSSITEYEIRRGLEYKQATSQMKKFSQLRATSYALAISGQVVRRAAAVYGELRRKGQLIGDADIFIAATALEMNFTVASNNTRHVNRVDGLRVENWLE